MIRYDICMLKKKEGKNDVCAKSCDGATFLAVLPRTVGEPVDRCRKPRLVERMGSCGPW